MVTFVLVHGAFQGPWVWAETARALALSGHEALRPALSGCGHLRGRPDAGAGLLAHIENLVRFIEDEGSKDVTLVANSYAGLAACGAAERLSGAVSRLVLVDGILPMQGKSFADMGGEPFRNMLARHGQAAPEGQPGSLVRPWPPAMFGVPAERAEWFQSRLGPMALAAFTDIYPGSARPPQALRTFIRCTPAGNPMLAAMADRAKAEGWAMQELTSGHCAPACVPVELARMLAVLAG